MTGKHLPIHILAVDALVINDRDEVLMIDSPKRGWEFPGGQVESGESLGDAIRREVLEEAGVEVEMVRLIGIFHNVEANLMVLGFLCRYLSGEPAPSSESRATEWVPRDGVLERASSEFIRARLADMMAGTARLIYRAHKRPRKAGQAPEMLEEFEI